MKNSAVVASLLAALISPSLAVVTWPITRREDMSLEAIRARNLFSRATITEALANNRTLYQATVSVGSPGQSLDLDIDTGSSDVYILASDCDQCNDPTVQAAAHGGCWGGVFDSAKSSTFKVAGQGTFKVSYGDKTGATGDYITDNFNIGGTTIQSLIIGLAHKATTGSGLIGIGYDLNEAGVQRGDLTKPYPSIVDTMFSQKLINTKSYSLWLNDYAATSGSIMFGGADTGKFIGQLKTVPFLTEQGVNLEFLVSMTGLSLTNQTGVNNQLTTSSFQIPVLLDSGTTLCLFPSNIVNAFVQIFSAVSTSGVLVVSCDYRSAQSKGYVSFAFGGSSGPVINVPIAELILPIPGTNECRLAMASTTSTYILGDAFLRSAYAVFDLDNNMAGLAQTNFDSSITNVVEFKSTDNGIPTLTGQATGTTLEPGVSSKSASEKVMPPFNGSALVVIAVSSILSLFGGLWFLT